MKNEVKMSAMGKTWVLDLDGTIVRHNGYKIDGKDSFLPGAEEFLKNIPETDMLIFLTSRRDEEIDGKVRAVRQETEDFLREHGIRYDQIIYGAPYGERILINDSKPSGLPMAFAFRPERDRLFEEQVVIDESL